MTNASDWAFTGTGLRNGSRVGRITGYEVDRSWSTYPLPRSQSYTILARSPVVDIKGNHDMANTVVYEAPSGAWVFASGTMGWSWGLQLPGYLNSEIQKITANVLNHFLATR